MRFETLRNKMLTDLNTLISQCDNTINQASIKEGDFLSLYNDINTSKIILARNLSISVHMSGIGDRSGFRDSDWAGSKGESRDLEAFRITNS